MKTTIVYHKKSIAQFPCKLWLFLLFALFAPLTLSAQTHYPIPNIKWSQDLENAAKGGDVEAQRNLGICIIYNLGIDRPENDAFQWFEKAAKKGDAEAQTYLGDFYYGEFGDLFEDEKKAYKWYKKAADQNFPHGIYLLSQCYLLGDGVAEDESKYISLLKKAADAGCANAHYDLAMEYNDGKHLPKDMAKYFHYFTLAADAGILNAMTTMGKAYYSGDGVSIDYNRAFKYLTNAVRYVEVNDSGYGWLDEGIKMLSACYRFGRGCEVNEQLADKYLLILSQMHGMDNDKIREVLKSLNIDDDGNEYNAGTIIRF